MDLYTEAAAVLKKFENKQGSVKSLVFAASYKNVRQLYALVCESLKYQPLLLRIFKNCESLQKEENLEGQPQLATVLLYDHLVGRGLGRAGKIRSCIVRHKQEIQHQCSVLLEEKGVASLGDLLSSQCQALNKLPIPRYARVNLLKTTVDEVVAAFTAEGWLWHGALNLASFHSGVESLRQEKFGLDPLLTDLLVFPPGTDLHDHPLTTAGNIVLQDRASCFPAHVLNPPKGATVLDCCAAPGNKTSHAASLMANSGKVLAYELDGKRMSLLRQQLRKAGVTNSTMVHQDFLSVDPHHQQFADVEYILVDPSCSGSGIMSRMDHVNNNQNSSSSATSQRLLKLQRFQISILKHALRFPAVRRVVYSTCSVHEEENEAVVREVAEQVTGMFKVKEIYPEFSHRGKGSDDIAKCCLRMSPKKDLTNGFFVACFERVEGEVGATEKDLKQSSGSSLTEEGKSVDCLQKKKQRGRVKNAGKREEYHFSDENGNASEQEHRVDQRDSGEAGQTEATDCKKKKNKKKRRGQAEEEHDSVAEEKVDNSEQEGSIHQGQCKEQEPEYKDGKKKRKKASEAWELGNDSASKVSMSVLVQGQNRDLPSHPLAQNGAEASQNLRKEKKKRKLMAMEEDHQEELVSSSVADQLEAEANSEGIVRKKRKRHTQAEGSGNGIGRGMEQDCSVAPSLCRDDQEPSERVKSSKKKKKMKRETIISIHRHKSPPQNASLDQSEKNQRNAADSQMLETAVVTKHKKKKKKKEKRVKQSSSQD